MLTEMRTANKCERSSPSERGLMDYPPERAIKETAATKKTEAAVTTSAEAEMAKTTTPVAKITTEQTTPIEVTKIRYKQQAWSMISRNPKRRGNG